jgi:hypothetical protein
VLAAAIIIVLMMEALSICETSVKYQTARRYNPEDSHLHSHRRENLRSCLIGVEPREFGVTYIALQVKKTTQDLSEGSLIVVHSNLCAKLAGVQRHFKTATLAVSRLGCARTAYRSDTSPVRAAVYGGSPLHTSLPQRAVLALR